MQKNILLLDDCFLGKQNKAEAYYTRGRHNNCDTIYIAKNYFSLPRVTVRENSNFIILFPEDVKNLTHIHADHGASSSTFAIEYGAVLVVVIISYIYLFIYLILIWLNTL